MRIYIAGPITGHEDYMKKFAEADEKISASGHTPVNPAGASGAFDYRTYINRGLAKLAECDAIYLMTGWQDSRGAMLEQHYAEAVGLMEYDEATGRWSRLPDFDMPE